MIVYNKEIDVNELKYVLMSKEDIVRHVVRKIPKWAKCIEGIENNQRYLYAITIRNMLSVPFKVRKEACNKLLEGIHLSGILNSFTSVKDLFSVCDTEKLIEALEWQMEVDNDTTKYTR